jgi:hypothetical protein
MEMESNDPEKTFRIVGVKYKLYPQNLTKSISATQLTPTKNISVITSNPSASRSLITRTYCQQTGKNREVMLQEEGYGRKSKYQVTVMLVITEYRPITIGASHAITNNDILAESGSTFTMRATLEGMLNLKPYVADVMVGNIDTISTISKGSYKGLVIQKDVTFLFHSP